MAKVILLFLFLLLIRFPLHYWGALQQAYHFNYIAIPLLALYLSKWIFPDVLKNKTKSAYWIMGLLLSGVGFLALFVAPGFVWPESEWGKFAISDIGRTIAWSWITLALCWLVGYKNQWVKNGKQ